MQDPPPPRYGAPGLLVSGVPNSEGFELADPQMSSETAGALVHSAFVLRHVLCVQKVQLLLYCVDGNDVAAILLQVCGSVSHLVPRPSRDWCACGLADCLR